MITFVAVFAMILAYVGLVVGYLALRTLARLRASNLVLARATVDGHRRDLLEIVEEQVRTTAAVAAELEQVRAELQTHRDTLHSAVQSGRQEINARLFQATSRLDGYRADIDTALAYAIRNVALVRYDAFDDMAGRMSFSVALLDDNGNGLTLSSIAGHADTRVYAKGIRDGRSDHGLTPEEEQAIAAAVRNQGERISADRVSTATRRRAERKAS